MRDISGLVQKATSQHGLLTTSQLRDLGWNTGAQKRLVAAGVLLPVRRGVQRLAGVAPTWEQRLLAVLLGSPGLAAASHRSALRLHRLRERFSGLEVVVPYPRGLAASGVIVHRSRTLDPADVTIVDGLPVTSPARTILDVAALFPDRELGRIIDHGVATGVLDIGHLLALRRTVGRSGVTGLGRFDRVAAQSCAFGGAESGPEIALARLLEEARLPPPEPQHEVEHRGRRFRIDLAYPIQRVGIEYDGFAAHRSHRSVEGDRQRQNLLVDAGWTLIRVTSRDLRERRAELVSLVRSALARFP